MPIGTAVGMPKGLDRRVQETGGAAGWPELHAAVGLSQRSLLSLLDSRRTPYVAPPPRGAGFVARPRPWDAGGVGSTPQGPLCCQAEARDDDQHRRASVQVNANPILCQRNVNARARRFSMCDVCAAFARLRRYCVSF